MTYINYLEKQILKYPVCEPIYTADLGKQLAKKFDLPIKKATAAATVAMKRILDGNRVPLLRKYKKGIYFITKKSSFGEMRINKRKIFEDLYLNKYGGYETGYRMLYKLGLTTQIPNKEVYAINGITQNKYLKDFDVYLVKAKGPITEENINYLIILDALDLMDKAPIDVINPMKILVSQIKQFQMDYKKLLMLAQKFYSTATVAKIAELLIIGDDTYAKISA